MKTNLTQLLQQIHDEADHILGTDYKNRAGATTAEIITKDCQAIKRLAKEAMKLIPKKHLCKCGANLGNPEAVTRTYISKNTENPDAHSQGHFDESGDYIPDRSPSYPLVSHDLVDGSDTCSACNAVVG